MLKKIIAVLSVVCMLTGVAYADDTLSFVTRFDSESGIIQLEGKGDGNITIRIAPDDVSPDEFEIKPPLVYDVIYADGEFVYECQLPLGAQSGGYTIYLRDAVNAETDSFRYFLVEVANEIVNSDGGINDALSSHDYIAFRNLMKTNAENLGIDLQDELYIEKSDNILKLVYDMNSSFEDASELYEQYNLAYAVVAMKGADRAKIESILSRYENILGIDFASDYTAETRLADSAKTALCNLIGGTTVADALAKGDSFKKVFSNLKAVSAVKVADKWQDISKAMTDTFAANYRFVFSENNDYKSLSSLTPVYSNMMSGINKVETLEDVQVVFDKAVIDALPKKNTSTGNGGSSISMPIGKVDPIVPSPTIPAQVTPFSDITSEFWGYNAIIEMNKQKVINGYEDGTFRPDKQITRAEFVKIITLMAGITGADSEFDDVAPSSWYAQYVGGAAKVGIVTGDGTRFNPDMPITRQDASVIVHRILKTKNGELTEYSKSFTDDAYIADYAKEAVSILGGMGVVNGKDSNKFDPFANLTRAEAAQLIFNAIEYIK